MSTLNVLENTRYLFYNTLKKQKRLHSQKGGNSSLNPSPRLNRLITSHLPNIFETGAKVVYKLMDSIAPTISDAVFGDLASRPWDDVAPELKSEIDKNKQFVKNILRDPEIRKAFIEIIDVYAELLIEVLDISAPMMEEIVDDFWDTMNKVGEKSMSGLVNTGINMTTAAVSEIPVVGGVIDLVIAITKAFNYYIAATKPLIINTGKVYAKTKRSYDSAVKTVDDYTEKIQDVQDRFQKLNTLTQTGGSDRKLFNKLLHKQTKTKKLKKRIRKTMKNISNQL